MIQTALFAAFAAMLVANQATTLNNALTVNRDVYASYTDAEIWGAASAFFVYYGIALILGVLGLVCSIRGFNCAEDLRNRRHFPKDEAVRTAVKKLQTLAIVWLALCGCNLVFGLIAGGTVITRILSWVIAVLYFWEVWSFREKHTTEEAKKA